MKNYLIGTLLLITIPVWAVEPFRATPAEEAMCQVRVYSRLSGRDKNTMHMHHYCAGLRYLDRAYAAMGNKQDMKYKLGVAINNFNYVLDKTEKDYPMRGEVHIGKARALNLLGEKAKAVVEFNKALRYEIASPDAYQALADHYLSVGNKAKALEMATEGLRRNPDSSGLKRRYTELGGKPPYPGPIEPTSVIETESVKAEEPPTPTPSLNSVELAASPTSTSSAPVEDITEPKIGSPTNPHCRFCPD